MIKLLLLIPLIICVRGVYLSYKERKRQERFNLECDKYFKEQL